MKKQSAVPKWGMSLFLWTSTILTANPSDPTVVSGDVSFSTPQTGTLQVSSNSSRSVVDWESFSIGSSETTNFVLPSSSSAILNRVTVIDAGNVSTIAGTLSSNGQVYLINPNGILIDTTGVVNTSAFLASTLDVDNQEFLNASDLTFTGGDDSDVHMTHLGTITADDGDIILLGYQVSGTGESNASNGTVAMGAGMEIVVQPNALDNRIVIVPQTLSKRAQGQLLTLPALGIDDSSAITAFKAELAADGNLYELAIQHEGVIEATGLVGSDCFVKYTAVDGKTVANGSVTAINNGSVGGTIAVLGSQVELENSCTLTASGNSGGGQIYVGGGWGGNDPDFMNAVTTTVHENVVMTVDANTNGNGGVAVVWANNTATFNGTINARGGSSSGDGGDVEISGLNTLNFNGNVDVTAANGSSGSLTLDPKRLNFRCHQKKVPYEIKLITRSHKR